MAVTPFVQTDRASGSGDTADHCILWLHPTDRTQSLLIGSSKDTSVGGLHVFDLSGNELDFLQVGALNNLDVRYNFTLGSATIDLIGGTNRTSNTVSFFTVDPDTLEVSSVGSHSVDTGNIYGYCLAHDRFTGKFYSIPNFQSGTVEQWEIDGSSGTIQASKARTISVGSQTEGSAADDFLGYLYVGQESTGIWRYGLDPSTGSSRISVDSVGSNNDLQADIEGITIYHENPESGYIVVSSQGNNRFAVYERESPHSYQGFFTITSGNGIDAVTETDGIYASNRDLNSTFQQGVFIAHDAATSQASSNYKVCRWQDIATELSLRTPSTDFDPRGDTVDLYVWGHHSDFSESTDPGGITWGDWSATQQIIVDGDEAEDSGGEPLNLSLTLGESDVETPTASVPEIDGEPLEILLTLGEGMTSTPEAGVPAISGEPINISLSLGPAETETPTASVPDVDGESLDVTVAFGQGAVSTPEAEVPEVLGASLSISLSLGEGEAETPTADIPMATGEPLVVNLTLGEALATVPEAGIPEVLGESLTISLALGEAEAEMPEASVPEVDGDALGILITLGTGSAVPPAEQFFDVDFTPLAPVIWSPGEALAPEIGKAAETMAPIIMIDATGIGPAVVEKSASPPAAIWNAEESEAVVNAESPEVVNHANGTMSIGGRDGGS